jgi:hypothetical protein
MVNEIAEWEAFCEGNSNYDYSDFIGLLARVWTEGDLKEIFRRVPFRDAVIDNLWRLYQCSDVGRHVYLRQKREHAASSDELISLILNFIESQRNYLLQVEIDEGVRKWLERSDIEVSFVEIETLSFVEQCRDLAPFIRQEESEHRTFREEAGLNISSADCIDFRVMAGINEALYGLVADYYLAWFVLTPIFDSQIDYGKYFEFWKGGGKYALTESQLLVSSIWGSDVG